MKESEKNNMKKINWKVRAKSPQFWIGLLGVIASPVLAYYGLSYADMTTWESVGSVIAQFLSNPFLLGTVAVAVLSFIGVLADPTTKGLGDSAQAMEYKNPKNDDEMTN